jgi:hypothetical protein
VIHGTTMVAAHVDELAERHSLARGDAEIYDVPLAIEF